MKITVEDNHCKGCVWLSEGDMCPFGRCVKDDIAPIKKGEMRNEPDEF